MQHFDGVQSWLTSLQLGQYSQLFTDAGYDMPTISRMTPEVTSFTLFAVNGYTEVSRPDLTHIRASSDDIIGRESGLVPCIRRRFLFVRANAVRLSYNTLNERRQHKPLKYIMNIQ
jgi:hypothetical protein